MDQKIPFTSYDFWGYLASGFLLLFVVDYVAQSCVFERTSWTVVQGVIAMAAAYVAGQLVASLSSALFERFLVKKLLGYPRDILFAKRSRKTHSWLNSLLGGYFDPLPKETAEAALARGKDARIEEPGDALFNAAYVCAHANAAAMGRLENFLNLYGFSRNTALVCFMAAALLYWFYARGPGSNTDAAWAVCALVAGAVLTLRYLKFLRLYAVELFTWYAYGKDVAGK